MPDEADIAGYTPKTIQKLLSTFKSFQLIETGDMAKFLAKFLAKLNATSARHPGHSRHRSNI